MAAPLKEVITDARRMQTYRCAHCDYPLSEVPLDPDLGVTCPECGYEMVFQVRVQLMPRDPEFDREVRGRLSRVERLLLILAIGLVVLTVGLGIIVMAIVGH